MLRDADIDSLNSHVSSLFRENEQHHASLQDLLTQFRSLLDDYSALKSDYEEVKDGREKYKKQARGQVRASKLRNQVWRANAATGAQSVRACSC
jgi:chromosome segregation ATPase